MNVPEWVQDAVFYQIFPDRFANGDLSNDPPNVEPWGSRPTIHGFQGGDLRGVTEKLDYLVDLGVNAIYLNPIFLSPSTHRYDTVDYFQIDPKLGTLDDFDILINQAHHRNIRIILDGVFNHCGRGFFAFNDVLENQEKSPYQDWFHIRRFPVQAYGPGEAEDYVAWWKFKSLPKFNTDNPKVRPMIMAIARYWIERGADGWRLDVPIDIDDDGFWAEFRHVVKAANSDAYLLGEIWELAPDWVGPKKFDGLMNYPLRDSVVDFFAEKKIPPTEFCEQLTSLIEAYSFEHTCGHYLPLGSHDTERIMTVFNNNLSSLRQALMMQFFYPGAPAIYYGDEIGLEGGKDPENRSPFNWDPAAWKTDLREHVRGLAHLRQELIQLRRGDFRVVCVNDEQGTCAFARKYDGGMAILAINHSDQTRRVDVPLSEMEGWPGDQRLQVYGDSFVERNEQALVVTLHPESAEIIYD